MPGTPKGQERAGKERKHSRCAVQKPLSNDLWVSLCSLCGSLCASHSMQVEFSTPQPCQDVSFATFFLPLFLFVEIMFRPCRNSEYLAKGLGTLQGKSKSKSNKKPTSPKICWTCWPQVQVQVQVDIICRTSKKSTYQCHQCFERL